MTEENPFALPAEEVETSCWREPTRGCSVECAAFDERHAVNDGYTPCMLLNIQRGQQRSLALIAQELKRQNDVAELALNRSSKAEAGDKLRQRIGEVTAPPPDIKV